jgi:hypothetical protein
VSKIRVGMRVKVDYSRPEARQREQRWTGRTGTVQRENSCGRGNIPGGLWYVLLDKTARAEEREICIAGACLMEADPLPDWTPADVRERIEAATKFKDGDIVRHIRTGDIYRVIFTPERNMAKVGDGEWIPTYSYRLQCDHTGPIFTRSQTDFERNFEIVASTAK